MGANQLDGLVFNGNSSISVSNQKLRIVKNGGTGVNRAGVSKTDNPFNPGGMGGFIKVSLTATVSNNTVNVPEGFRLSIGALMWGTAPAAPDVTKVHSDLYINPTATPGTFILKAGNSSALVSSTVLSGTRKLVWYINNSGSAVNYIAPNGTIANIGNDTADVWAINGTVATLVLNEVPATTPAVEGLRTLKISNDPNFVATLDIDDLVISEEVSVPAVPVVQNNFSQNFNAGGEYLHYTSTESDATANNKFIGIAANTAASITNSKLRFERLNVSNFLSSWTIGGNVSPLAPTPSVAKISMQYAITNNAGYTNQRTYLTVGEGFSANQFPPVDGNIHSSFSIRTTGTAGQFYVNNGSNETQNKGTAVGPYTGTVIFTWVVNDSGASQTYTAPNGSLNQVDNDKWDLYIGNTLVLNEQEAINGSKKLSGVKYAFGNTNGSSNVSGKMTVDMDNINFQTLSTAISSMAMSTAEQAGVTMRHDNFKITNNEGENSFKIYTLTDTETRFLINSKMNTVGDLIIYDLNGRVLFKKSMTLQQGSNLVPISNVEFLKGLYISSLHMNGQFLSLKFIK